MEATLTLLRFNCPSENCRYVANEWDELQLHVRGVHKRLLWYARFPLQTPGAT